MPWMRAFLRVLDLLEVGAGSFCFSSSVEPERTRSLESLSDDEVDVGAPASADTVSVGSGAAGAGFASCECNPGAKQTTIAQKTLRLSKRERIFMVNYRRTERKVR